MAYISPPMGNRLGIFAQQIEKKRRELNLDSKGYPMHLDLPANADNDKEIDTSGEAP